MPVNGFDYFRSQGWTDFQAAAILGNGIGESGLNPRAIGDGGRAVGAFQWHPDRQANFQRVIGTDIRNSTLAQQYQFVNWELNNTEKRAGNWLRSTTNVNDATYAVMKGYERPANGSSFGARLNGAVSVLKKGADILNNDTARAAAAIITGGASEAVLSVTDGLGITGDKSWLEQFQDWLKEAAFFQRLALALVGLIVLLAAFYLLKEQVAAPVVKLATSAAL